MYASVQTTRSFQGYIYSSPKKLIPTKLACFAASGLGAVYLTGMDQKFAVTASFLWRILERGSIKLGFYIFMHACGLD
jgi:hypothetical protein